jgi:hypothetical protein
MILRPDANPRNHWICFQLQGKTDRLALNARVRVAAGDLVQLGEVISGGSFCPKRSAPALQPRGPRPHGPALLHGPMAAEPKSLKILPAIASVRSAKGRTSSQPYRSLKRYPRISLSVTRLGKRFTVIRSLRRHIHLDNIPSGRVIVFSPGIPSLVCAPKFPA